MAERVSRFSSNTGELHREFKRVDRNQDGKVSFEEFKELLEGLDAGMTEVEMHIGFREVDTDKDALISCQEFVEWWSSD